MSEDRIRYLMEQLVLVQKCYQMCEGDGHVFGLSASESLYLYKKDLRKMLADEIDKTMGYE